MALDNILEEFEQNAPCDSVAFQDAVVVNHEVAVATFDNMLAEFYGANVAPPKVYDAVGIAAIYGSNSCSLYKIRIDADETIIDSNSDIAFSVVSINAALLPALEKLDLTNKDNRELLAALANGFHTHYSIPLFKGLVRQFPNADYEFYKARCPTCKKFSVIFKVTSQATGTPGPVIVHYRGDMSGLEP